MACAEDRFGLDMAVQPGQGMAEGGQDIRLPGRQLGGKAKLGQGGLGLAGGLQQPCGRQRPAGGEGIGRRPGGDPLQRGLGTQLRLQRLGEEPGRGGMGGAAGQDRAGPAGSGGGLALRQVEPGQRQGQLRLRRVAVLGAGQQGAGLAGVAGFLGQGGQGGQGRDMAGSRASGDRNRAAAAAASPRSPAMVPRRKGGSAWSGRAAMACCSGGTAAASRPSACSAMPRFSAA